MSSNKVTNSTTKATASTTQRRTSTGSAPTSSNQSSSHKTKSTSQKVFYGKPEKQRDASAINLHHKVTEKKSPAPQPPQPPKVVKVAPRLIPPPAHLHTVSEEQAAAQSKPPDFESVFATKVKVSVYPIMETLAPETTALPALVSQSYELMVKQKPNLLSKFSEAMLLYATTVAAQSKMVASKVNNGYTLTPEESMIALSLEAIPCTLPKPIMQHIAGLGNFQHQHTQFTPLFPSWPCASNGNHGGFYPVDSSSLENYMFASKHVSVGMAAARLCVTNSKKLAKPPLPFDVDPTPLYPGYQSDGPVHKDICDTLRKIGITESSFPEYPQNTGYCLPLLQYILGEMEALPSEWTETRPFFDPAAGSPRQMVYTKSVSTGYRTHNVSMSHRLDSSRDLGYCLMSPYNLVRDPDFSGAYHWCIFNHNTYAPVPQPVLSQRNWPYSGFDPFGRHQFRSNALDPSEMLRTYLVQFFAL